MITSEDSTKFATVDHADPSLSLMVRLKSIDSSSTPGPKVREELFLLKIQVKQEIHTGIQKKLGSEVWPTNHTSSKPISIELDP